MNVSSVFHLTETFTTSIYCIIYVTSSLREIGLILKLFKMYCSVNENYRILQYSLKPKEKRHLYCSKTNIPFLLSERVHGDYIGQFKQKYIRICIWEHSPGNQNILCKHECNVFSGNLQGRYFKQKGTKSRNQYRQNWR